MTLSLLRRPRPAALAVLALALVPAGALASGGGGTGHRERLVVRGADTVLDGPCDARGCAIRLAGGTFHGTPAGSGAYTGALRLRVARAFANGEGGVCAPIRGRLVLGAGSADRLVLAVAGDSCQDGAGDPSAAAFTGLARFSVRRGTGAYAKASGSGLAVFSEGADDRERVTLIGRVAR